MTANPRSSLEALAQKWREQADATEEHRVGLSWAHGVRITLRSCAAEVDAALAAQPAQTPIVLSDGTVPASSAFIDGRGLDGILRCCNICGKLKDSGFLLKGTELYCSQCWSTVVNH